MNFHTRGVLLYHRDNPYISGNNRVNAGFFRKFYKLGKSVGASKQIPDETLCAVTADFLGIPEFDADVFEKKINKITVPEANRLIYHFKDGHTVEMVWKDRSRSESWTPEKREQARQNSLKRRNQEWRNQ